MIFGDEEQIHIMLQMCFDKLTEHDDRQKLQKIVYYDYGATTTCDFIENNLNIN